MTVPSNDQYNSVYTTVISYLPKPGTALNGTGRYKTKCSVLYRPVPGFHAVPFCVFLIIVPYHSVPYIFYEGSILNVLHVRPQLKHINFNYTGKTFFHFLSYRFGLVCYVPSYFVGACCTVNKKKNTTQTKVSQQYKFIYKFTYQ